jgi:pyruvate/2-oxoglutarate dehydrogenase complex dihydrolipoamide dehydrogenase (E3) component
MTTVAVIGGGYGGITAAKALDDIADVTLIEPRDKFVHNVATLRAVVAPEWAERLFLPYDHLLAHGTIVRERATRISGTQLELASGTVLEPDFTVVATGSNHRYPAKLPMTDSASAKEQLRRTHEALSQAARVVLLGAGPVGLELAGEIKAVWPEKSVTILDPAPELLLGRYPAEFTAEIHAQLDRLGVDLVLNASLMRQPATEPGTLGAFTVTTTAGTDIVGDIWFACYGATPNTEALTAGGEITVGTGGLVEEHAAVAAATIRAEILGTGEPAGYTAAADAIVLPLGPSGGAGYAKEAGVLGPEAIVGIKGNLYLDLYRSLLNLDEVTV